MRTGRRVGVFVSSQHAFGRGVRYIAADDIFQMDLSQRFALPAPAEPLGEYHETFDKARALLEAVAETTADAAHK